MSQQAETSTLLPLCGHLYRGTQLTYSCRKEEGHRGVHQNGEQFWFKEDSYWPDIAEQAPEPLFTDAELAILLTALQPVKQFFPDLMAKLHRARAGVQ